MMNPLFNLLGGNRQPNNNILQRFQQFKNSFKGDPRQQIQDLLNSGKISQTDYDNAVKMANEIMRMMK